MIFAFLPEDVIHYILLYNDTIKYRNGKYMNQICKKDKRYELLLKIPPIIKIYEDKHVFAMFYATSTNTGLYIDLENNTIIYTFCYDIKKNPDKYNLWIRR